MKASDEVAAKLAELERLAGPTPDEKTAEVIRKGHAGIAEMRRAEDGLELVNGLVSDLAAVTAPVYAPDDPRGFDFVTEAEEERPETRTGGPTRYRPRLGPRKPAGRVW